MSIPVECEICKRPHNFRKQVSGSCSTCNKRDMCEDCCLSHKCIEGKVRQLGIISNPAWIMNLIYPEEKKERENE
jgi:hypothetical protein